MANPPITIRFRPIEIAYLDELGAIGGFGKGRNGVIRRFVENGIARAIERRVVEKRNPTDHPEPPPDRDDDDE